jgi:LmbE family N-acetylglucosaminyl deacetylase
MLECSRRLGLAPADVRQLGLEDQTLEQREDELIGLIGSLLDELAPDEVYVTGPFESHRDHAALGRAARRAIAARRNRPVLREYPVWLWAQLWYGSDEPLGRRLLTVARAAAVALNLRRAVVIRTDAMMPRKQHALAAHTSQLRRPAMVPDDHPWPVLPPVVLDAAVDRVELFLPWPPSVKRRRGDGSNGGLA